MNKFYMGRGFSLIEVLVVVAVIGILAAIAYPSYQGSVAKSRRADAQSALAGLAQAMERHFTENNTYESAIAGTAPQPPIIFPTQAPLDGSTKFYNLIVQTVTPTTYTLRATPIGGQAGDGNVDLTSTGIKRWDRGNDGFGATDNCWSSKC